jgi:hypothetical protein
VSPITFAPSIAGEFPPPAAGEFLPSIAAEDVWRLVRGIDTVAASPDYARGTAMGRREDILSNAYWWGAYGNFKVSPSELRYICDTAVRADQGRAVGMPTDKNITDSMGESTGVFFGTQKKHWCGIFCCMLLREAGLDVKWTLGTLKADQKKDLPTQEAGMLTAGHMYNVTGSAITLVYSGVGVKAGDVAIISAANHHFLITGVDPVAKKYTTLEGNTTGQIIKSGLRSFRPAAADQTIIAYYRIQ